MLYCLNKLILFEISMSGLIFQIYFQKLVINKCLIYAISRVNIEFSLNLTRFFQNSSGSKVIWKFNENHFKPNTKKIVPVYCVCVWKCTMEKATNTHTTVESVYSGAFHCSTVPISINIPQTHLHIIFIRAKWREPTHGRLHPTVICFSLWIVFDNEQRSAK